MILIEVTPEIRKEIQNSVNEFDAMIKEEMAFSVDLRKHELVIKYTNEIVRLQKALIDGVL